VHDTLYVTHGASHVRFVIVNLLRRCVYKTMQIAVVAEESVPQAQADTRSVCVIRTIVDNISSDTERRAGLSAITEPLNFPPVGVQSIAISVSVCLSVCLNARISEKTTC